MKLAEIFSQLTYGELSQVSLGGGEAGVIDATNYKHVITHINLGLTALHKRFNLREEVLIVPLILGQVIYPFKSITEFKNNLVKVQSVKTELGFEMALNDQSDKYSVFTPIFNVLTIPLSLVSTHLPDFPRELITDTLTVSYQSNALPIVYDDGLDDDPEDLEVNLPDTYLEPLLYFVASRVLTNTGTGQFEGAIGSNYAARYEKACKDIEEFGLDIDQGSQSTRLRSNGWV